MTSDYGNLYHKVKTKKQKNYVEKVPTTRTYTLATKESVIERLTKAKEVLVQYRQYY